MSCNCTGACRKYGRCDGQPLWNVPQTIAIFPGMVAGHCGKCGAPYTFDPIPGSTQANYTPSCNCWNR